MFDNDHRPAYDPEEHRASTTQIKGAWWVAVATMLLGLVLLELF